MQEFSEYCSQTFFLLSKMALFMKNKNISKHCASRANFWREKVISFSIALLFYGV